MTGVSYGCWLCNVAWQSEFTCIGPSWTRNRFRMSHYRIHRRACLLQCRSNCSWSWTGVVFLGTADRGHQRQLTADRPDICMIKSQTIITNFYKVCAWGCQPLKNNRNSSRSTETADRPGICMNKSQTIITNFYKVCAGGCQPLKNNRNSSRSTETCIAT